MSPARGTDHSRDAGGDPEVLEAKRALREDVWARLAEARAARFPGAHGRIPNFTGAEDAARLLAAEDFWQAAATVKANPDSPQRPVRRRALEDGLAVYMATPRLAAEQPFFRLDPARLAVSPVQASSIKGAAEHGELVAVAELAPVDLVVVGSVAVDRRGARLGKGGGFADLEFALAGAAGLVAEDTLVVTTVHALQLVDQGRIPMRAHDVPVDVVITPGEVIHCARGHPRPRGIHWGDLTEQKIRSIPLLARLQGEA